MVLLSYFVHKDTSSQNFGPKTIDNEITNSGAQNVAQLLARVRKEEGKIIDLYFVLWVELNSLFCNESLYFAWVCHDM